MRMPHPVPVVPRMRFGCRLYDRHPGIGDASLSSRRLLRFCLQCARCTYSIAATSRATNGHRFVFHSSEVISTERHYISDEPGVLPYETMAATQANLHQFVSSPVPTAIHSNPRPSQWPQGHQSDSRPSPITSDYPRTHAPGLINSTVDSSSPRISDSVFQGPDSAVYPTLHASLSFSGRFAPHPYLRSQSPSLQHALHSSDRPLSAASFISPGSPPAFYPSFPSNLPSEQKQPGKLEYGDVLFWHHLARTGEFPGIEDDMRARGFGKCCL